MPRRKSKSKSCPKGYYRPKPGAKCRKGITAKEGMLSKHGYENVKQKSKRARMQALERAIRAQKKKKSKRAAVMAVKQHLNARANLLTRQSPKSSRAMRADYKSIMKKHRDVLEK